MPTAGPPDVHIGTSGWVYRWWRGVFYPDGLPQRLWLDHYVRHFSTVEINATFYRLPGPETFDHWRGTAPGGFVYALKASRRITHLARLNDCAEALDMFIASARRLGPALGPLLYQLPPSFAADPDRLEAFAAMLPGDLAHVFEFRNESWFDDAIFALLDGNGLGFCVHDHAGVTVPDRATGGMAYYRFHGAGGDHARSYSRAALARMSKRVQTMAARGIAVHAYFNNDGGGCAVRDAMRLKDMIADAGSHEETETR